MSAHCLRISKQRVNVHTQGPSDVCVTANRQQLFLVLTNLVLNGLDALEETTDPRIDIVWNTENNRLALKVIDNGPGISPDNLHQVFDAFFSTKPDRGTGIGLATVRKIVEMYGGSVRVTSAPDEGAVFILDLPLSDDGKKRISVK